MSPLLTPLGGQQRDTNSVWNFLIPVAPTRAAFREFIGNSICAEGEFSIPSFFLAWGKNGRMARSRGYSLQVTPKKERAKGTTVARWKGWPTKKDGPQKEANGIFGAPKERKEEEGTMYGEPFY